MSAPHEIIEIDRRRFATMLKDADGNLNKVSISALSNRRSADEFVQLITARRTRAVENIVAIGQYLREAKEELDHGEFGPMLKRIQFSEGTARKYMAIAAHPVISNRSNWNALPPSWTTLYQRTKLPHGIFQARIDDYTVTPEFEGAVVAALKAGLEVRASATPRSASPNFSGKTISCGPKSRRCEPNWKIGKRRKRRATGGGPRH